MVKESIICTIVILIIIIGNNTSYNYAKETIDNLTTQLGELKESIQKDDSNDSVKNKIDEINNYWSSKYTNLAYFIEHSELEKEQIGLAEVKSNINTGENSEAIVQLDKSIEVLNNINDKLSLKWENIL